MIKEDLDVAIRDMEKRNAKTTAVIADLTNDLVRRENALQCLHRIREDMDTDADRVDALEWLLDSLKITGVI